MCQRRHQRRNNARVVFNTIWSIIGQRNLIAFLTSTGEKMITNDQFMRICNFTRQYLKETAATSEQEWLKNFPRAAEHRWQHTLNVLHNAEMILDGEKADQNKKDIIRVAVIS
jgi:ABC-type transporter MlaC component